MGQKLGLGLIIGVLARIRIVRVMMVRAMRMRMRMGMRLMLGMQWRMVRDLTMVVAIMMIPNYKHQDAFIKSNDERIQADDEDFFQARKMRTELRML